MSTIDRIATAGVSALRGLLVAALAWGGIALPAPSRAAEEPSEPEAPAKLLTADELQEVVGPIALYPDELVAVVLPASTWPLQIVQAARVLDKRKSDPDLKPEEDWDPSVIGLMNYPEVITLMNDDLDWTWKLGEAVAAQQDDVMDAIQTFRGHADDAGNLATNDKVTVQTETKGEDKIIVIESASPEVIYVPQYNPTTVVVQQPAPYPYYYSSPYPYYYRPAAAFWTGMFVGAAIGWGCSWGHRGYGGHNNINVNRNVNVNVARPTRPSTPNRPNQGGGGQKWNADRGPNSQAGGRPGGQDRARAGTQPGGSRPGGGERASSGARPGGDRAGSRPSTGTRDAKAGSTRPGGGDKAARTSTGASKKTSAGGHSRSTGRDLTSPSSSKKSSRSSSMGSYGSGSRTRSSGSRGASSRGGSRGGGGGRRR